MVVSVYKNKKNNKCILLRCPALDQMYDISRHSKSHPKLFKNDLYVVGNTILSSAVTCTYSNLTSDKASGKSVVFIDQQ